MKIQQKAIIGIIVIIGFIFFSAKSTNGLTNDEVNKIISTVKESFDKAESIVFDQKPDVPDDGPTGPDPDPEKCICEGTGKIIQGDGHVTPCPYHSEDSKSEEVPSFESPTIYRVIPRRRIFGNFFR